MQNNQRLSCMHCYRPDGRGERSRQPAAQVMYNPDSEIEGKFRMQETENISRNLLFAIMPPSSLRNFPYHSPSSSILECPKLLWRRKHGDVMELLRCAGG